MEIVKMEGKVGTPVDPKSIPEEVTPDDEQRFYRIISTDLTPEQKQRVLKPAKSYPRQNRVLAVHWHPEFIPMQMCLQRVDALYPNKEEELLIPTQHNVLLSVNGYSGVEVDCYASGFDRKVQLLLHFKEERVHDGAEVLKAMLAHTLKYRSSQFYELLEALDDCNTEEAWQEKRQKAASDTGADEVVVEFCGIYARKLRSIVEDKWNEVPREMIKNKLIRNLLDTLRDVYGDRFINRAQVYVKAVKKLVKENFSLKFFYRASEIIEEARSLGAGVVIPHPEQFWPILLADYDVDGIEVWNPQSRQYTDFLIHVVTEKNKNRTKGTRPVMIFMGDDCHMGEKVKAPGEADPEKGAREIGLQPAWDDMAVRKGLIVAGVDRSIIINEYKERLA